MGRWDQSGTSKTSSNRHFARSFLEVLLASPPARHGRSSYPKSSSQWQCSACSFSNYSWRKTCYGCGEAWTSHKNVQEKGSKQDESTSITWTPYQVKPAPWEKSQAVSSDVIALEAAIRGIKTAGAGEILVKEMEEKLQKMKQEVSHERPLLDRILGCRSFIERTEKRMINTKDALDKIQLTYNTLDTDLKKHKEKLIELESEAELQRAESQDLHMGDVEISDAAQASIEELKTSIAEMQGKHEQSIKFM